MQKIDITNKTTNTPLTLSAGKKEIPNSINYCSCKNLETDCWNHGLWSTFGKSYPEWICKLSSTLIRDCYGSDGTYVCVCVRVWVCLCVCVRGGWDGWVSVYGCLCLCVMMSACTYVHTYARLNVRNAYTCIQTQHSIFFSSGTWILLYPTHATLLSLLLLLSLLSLLSSL